MDSTEIIKSLREMAFLFYRMGDFPKQKTLEAAADRLYALQQENNALKKQNKENKI